MPLIFTLSEIWQINSKYASIDHYSFIKKERINSKRGGGVGVYIREDVIFKRSFIVEKDFDDKIDVIAIDMVLNKIKILLITIYRPPESSKNILIMNLKLTTPTLKSKYPNHAIIFIGDFNDDLHNKTSDLLLCFSSMGFTQLINNPTRLTATCKTIIDHLYVNNLKLVNQSGALEMGISDHLSIWLTLNVKIRQIKVANRTIHYRKTDNIYNIDPCSFDKLTIDNNLNTSEKFIFSLGYLQHIFDNVCPMKTITVSKAICPWRKHISIKLAKQEKKSVFGTFSKR